MPKWGLTMTEGKSADWLVPEKLEVEAGVEVVEIETDKILSPLEAPVAGVLRRQVALQDALVPVSGLIGVIADPAVSEAEIDEFISSFQSRFVPAAAGESGAARLTATVEVCGHSLHYLKIGDGEEAAILIHGFGGDLNTWLYNHEALAADRSVYALDLRGHGGSSKQVGCATLDQFAGDLGGFLDAIGLTKVHIAGHSMGGAVGLQFALRHPGRVASLTLIAAAGLGLEIDGAYIQGFITAGRRKEMSSQIEKLFADPKLVTRRLVEDVLKFKRLDGVEASLRAIAGQLYAGDRQITMLRDRFSELPMPVLVIWGTEDRILPPSHAEGLPQTVRVVTIPGCGHMVHMEAAQKVNRLMTHFWDSAGAK